MTITSHAVDTAVADARNLPDLVAKLETVNPDMAQQFTGKTLAASRTPWGVLAVSGVSWAVAKYGLGWDQNIVDLIAGAGVLAGGFAMRYITSIPINGVFKRKPTLPPPAPPGEPIPDVNGAHE